MHVVRSLTFQHHADDNVDDDNKSLADILHIPEKNKKLRFVYFETLTTVEKSISSKSSLSLHRVQKVSTCICVKNNISEIYIFDAFLWRS